MRWTWDPDKAAANRLKHGLSFETACFCLTTRSMHRDRTHTRTAIAGTRSDSSGPVLLLVVHTGPEDSEDGEQVGRIISARKATAHERRAYEEGAF